MALITDVLYAPDSRKIGWKKSHKIARYIKEHDEWRRSKLLTHGGEVGWWRHELWEHGGPAVKQDLAQ